MRFSAGGSAKQGRDRSTQAILPLKGKIINCEKARLSKVLSSNEIATLITALGGGIGNSTNDNDEDDESFKTDKLRYKKVIIMTDADVDGAHIKTLLLTFFYRQMRPLITDGCLYIAQPPLYKAKKGNSETYLKDDDNLENYLIDSGINESSYILSSGGAIASNDLIDLVGKSRNFKKVINSLHKKYDQGFVESAAISGAFANSLKVSDDKLFEISNRLTKKYSDINANWNVTYHEENGLLASREVRGVSEKMTIGKGFFNSSDARRLEKISDEIKQFYPHIDQETSNIFERDGRSYVISGPIDLIESIFSEGRKGLQIQRYKGLGEMNAEQLWDTTLDPDSRRLLRVKIDSGVDNSGIFADLMGDEVIKRREFIQDSIESGDLVANLDI